MAEVFTFDCGCKFPVIENNSTFPKIEFTPKLSDISLECEKTWDLISDGNTKGCFQLESRLGQTMARKLKPKNIYQLSGLISILRPGCLEAMRDGKSVSNHYIDKKNGLESIDYFHPALEPILKDTYSEMIYQEQAMSIAKQLAGFNLKEADDLRKAIGKKQADKMAKVKEQFIIGSKNKGLINEQEAEQIFEWIEKSQRYLFNASHSISYAMNAYLSAYAKAHFPKVFFASYLRFAKDKIDPQQEIKELVRNAIEMDIDISIPDFRNLNELFILKDKKIYFGLTDIKGVGKSVYSKILEIMKDKNPQEMSWMDIISSVLLNINSNAAKALISCGAFDYYKKNRSEMVFEYDICSKLTKKEHISLNHYLSVKKDSGIVEAFRYIYDNTKLIKTRKEAIGNLISLLNSPPYSLIDKIEWLSDSENSLLGVGITCSKLDVYDITNANCNCKTFKTSLIKDNIILAGEISNVNVTKTKTGKNPGLEMAFVTIEDQYGTLDTVVFFPEAFSKYRSNIFTGNILVFVGNKSKSKDGLIVEKCFIPAS
jgi:DNA polymerase-3 subunit alpha